MEEKSGISCLCRSLLKALIHLLLHSSAEVRAAVKTSVRRLLHGLRGVELCLQLLGEFESVLRELQVGRLGVPTDAARDLRHRLVFQEQQRSTAVNGAAGESAVGESEAVLSSHQLCQALLAVTGLQSSRETLPDRYQVALRALMPATHPLLGQCPLRLRPLPSCFLSPACRCSFVSQHAVGVAVMPVAAWRSGGRPVGLRPRHGGATISRSRHNR